jgi:predicted RNA methylase
VTIPSPNIWDSPEVYELENLGVDRAGVIEAAMREVHDWAGRDVLDIGCGTGFHLPRFAATARTVVGVEPHPPLVVRARRRVAALPSVRVVQAGRVDDAPDASRRRGARAVGDTSSARAANPGWPSWTG